MVLRLEADWVWDFWLVGDGTQHHLFFLHAPRTPEDPNLRHQNATIGHAVSGDLMHWDMLPDPFDRGAPGSWDDAATWTGSIVETSVGWAMLYTGAAAADNLLVQRIGLARSPDLLHWRKHYANPILEVDPRWYETLDLDLWHDQAWRDPYIVRDPTEGIFHAFLTARAAGGPPQGRGVIGHATSPDLENWTVLPPLEGPAGFGYMEIPQVVRLGALWHLLFSAPAWAQGRRCGPNAMTGTFHAVSDRIDGPYREVAPLFIDRSERLYGGKLVEVDGRMVCLAFRYLDESGAFVGEIADPRPIIVTGEGRIVVEDVDGLLTRPRP